MAVYRHQLSQCSLCKQTKKILVEVNVAPEDLSIICSSCRPTTQLFPPGTKLPHHRDSSRPTVSNITGFGKSFDDFDRDYDRLQREGA